MDLTNSGLDYSQASVATNPATGEPMVRIPRVKFFPNQAALGKEYAKDAASQAQPSRSDVQGGIPMPVSVGSDQPEQSAWPTASTSTVDGQISGNDVSTVASPAPVMPKMFRPTFAQTLTDPQGLPAPMNAAQTKLGKFVALMTAAVRGGLAGWGTGNPAAGAQQAREIPFQEAQQRQQLAQGRAQTGLLQAEQQDVNIPGVGALPAWLARTMGPAWIRGQSAQAVQGMKGQTAQNIASARLTSEQMKFAIQNGQVAHVEDGIDPETNQPAKMGYDRTGHLVGVLPGSLPSSAYLPKATDTVEYKENENGDIVALPKRTTTQPAIPGTPQPPASGTSTPRVVAHGPKASKENDAAAAEQLAGTILNAAGGDPDKALKVFDQRSGSITDPEQIRLGPSILKAIRARRQINKPQNPIDKIISGDVEGGLNDLQSNPSNPQ